MKFIYLIISLLFITNKISTQAVQPYFGTYHHTQDGPCLNQEYRAELINRIKSSKHYKVPNLEKSGSVEPFLIWPTKHTPTVSNINDPGYFGISNYVDRNLNFPDQVQDWNCGDRTYDTTWGYNHGGTDIFSYPFPWEKLINNEVRAVAAADGFIVDIDDGFYDRNCGSLVQNSSRANSITIRHLNGYHTLYLHLKKNSITSKEVGDPVIAGEVLGVIASSGNSTGPHLHFEVWDENFQIVEPFYNANQPLCNTTTENSLWLEQVEYYDPKINKVMITTEIAEFGDCDYRDEGEIYTEVDRVDFNQEFYCYLFLKDQQRDDDVIVQLVRPDGSIYYQHTLNCQTVTNACYYYSSSWWYYPFVIPSTEPCGEWAFEVTFKGFNESSSFLLGDNPSIDLVEGNFTPEPMVEEIYLVPNSTANSRYFWSAFSGTIVAGQNTAELTVVWDNVGSGLLCVNEISEAGCRSEALCEDVMIGTSAINKINSTALKIYPNPFTAQINLELESNSPINWLLYDIKGNLLFNRQSTSTAIEFILAELKPGTYILSVQYQKSSYIKKLLKL